MKKTLLLIGAFAFTALSAQQQATVNVNLYPIQTIIVNATNATVDLDYITAADYNDGVDATIVDHLSIYSTGAFAVKIKSDLATLESTNAGITENIASSDILVTASAGTAANTITGATYQGAVALTTTPQELFESATGGVNKSFTVNYAAKGAANTYVNKYFNVENPTVYTTTVTYSIEAR